MQPTRVSPGTTPSARPFHCKPLLPGTVPTLSACRLQRLPALPVPWPSDAPFLGGGQGRRNARRKAPGRSAHRWYGIQARPCTIARSRLSRPPRPATRPPGCPCFKCRSDEAAPCSKISTHCASRFLHLGLQFFCPIKSFLHPRTVIIPKKSKKK